MLLRIEQINNQSTGSYEQVLSQEQLGERTGRIKAECILEVNTDIRQLYVKVKVGGEKDNANHRKEKRRSKVKKAEANSRENSPRCVVR